MPQSDLIIVNQTFPAFRSSLNAALQANGTLQSGDSAPSNPYSCQLWADTTTALLKQRNSGNTAWITQGRLNQSFFGITPADIGAMPASQFINEVLVLQNGFTTANSSPLTIFRKGDMGFIRGFIGRGTAPPVGTQITTITNTNLRPQRQLSVAALDGGSGTFIGRIEIYPDGIIQFISGNMPIGFNASPLIFF